MPTSGNLLICFLPSSLRHILAIVVSAYSRSQSTGQGTCILLR